MDWTLLLFLHTRVTFCVLLRQTWHVLEKVFDLQNQPKFTIWEATRNYNFHYTIFHLPSSIRGANKARKPGDYCSCNLKQNLNTISIYRGGRVRLKPRDERHSVKYKYGYSKEQNRQTDRERQRETEVEVNKGGYHFILFHAHITLEYLFKGTWTNLSIIHATTVKPYYNV